MKKKLLSLILAASMFMGTATDVYAVSDIAVTAESLVEDQDELGIVIEDDAEESTEDSSEVASTEDETLEDSLVIIDDGDDDSASASSSDVAIIESSEDASDASSEDASDEDEIDIFDENATDASSEESSDESDIASSEDSINPEDILLNYRDVEFSDQFESVLEGIEDSESYDDFVNETYPAKYTTPKLPNLRDQNPYGSCWAHAEMALAEISLLKKGILNSADMSEVHTAYFTYNSVKDPLGGTDGDSNAIGRNQRDNFLNLGGNLLLGSNVLSNWVGAADESVAPYKNASQYVRSGLNSNLAYKDAAHLLNYYTTTYSTSSADINAVKKLIVDYGAVGISYYHDNLYSDIYNSRNNCYYNKRAYRDYFNRVETNHAVTVVGWDDNFSRYNFTNTPAGNGAWLVRNSWTTRNNEYSLNGYFWMSYYEPNIGESIMAMDFGPSNNYANNYQYDGSMMPAEIAGTKFANVFTAHSGSATESLQAVSFMTPTSNTKYTIKVYKDVNGTNPESGSCVSTVSGSQSYAGYYTVPLPKAVVLNKGTKFSVVVQLAKANGGSVSMGCEGKYDGWFASKFKITRGQSFVFSGSWKDMVDKTSSYGNLKIKAFTSNGGSAPAPTPGVVQVTLNPNGGKGKVKVIKIKNGKYSGLTKPTRSGFTFTGWYYNGKKVVNKQALATNSNHTLDAYWKPDTIVTFNTNGGNKIAAKKIKFNATKNQYGAVKKPGTPKRKGYTFVNWYLNGRVYDFNSAVSSNITLTAGWTANKYTVTFLPNGGNGNEVTRTFTYDQKANGVPGYSKYGYNFTGWGKSKSGKALPSLVNLATKNGAKVKLYAHWSVWTADVYFNANGGTIGKSGQAVKTVKFVVNKKNPNTGSWGKVSKPSTPKRKGYKFTGWYTDRNCRNAWNFKNSASPKMTLYAGWKPANKK